MGIINDLKTWKYMNWWLRLPIILFVIGSILDLFFTTRNYIMLDYLPELNPLLKILHGNYWAFLGFNIFLTCCMIIIFFKSFNNDKTTLNSKYMLYSVVLLAGIMRFLGAWSNFQWVIHPVTDPVVIEQIKTTVVEQGTKIYYNFVWNWIIYPFIMLYTMFYLFNKAVHLKEDKQYNEKKK